MTPDDPRWPRADTWLGGDHLPDPAATLAVVDLPMHLASLSPTRADRAPQAIRAALARFSTWDGGRDLRSVAASQMPDPGVASASPEDAVGIVARGLEGITADALVLLGGDNSITRPAVRALGRPLDRVGLLTFDAHHDLRDTAHGLSNGNPVRALLEDGLPGEHIVQVGIQPFANSPEYAAVARDAGIAVVTADEVRARGMPAVVSEALGALEDLDAIHVDLDVDVLDRAFAPACPGARPGGLTPAELQTAARRCGAHRKVAAMDLVEVDPDRDIGEVTVLAAASFLLAFAGGLAARSSGAPGPR